MNLKKSWKRFWTLSRSHAEGFTLVELIVVIAILAILAGVAVPAYSGYTVRANKGADQSLISEVADALQLHYYNNGDLNACGFVILKANGDAVADPVFGANAMDAVFGSTWSSVTLSYHDWQSNGLVDSALAEGAAKIPGSAFASDTDKLLGYVNNLTYAATGALKGATSSISDKMGTLGLSNDAMGYIYSVCGEDLDEADPAVLANAVVIATAMDQAKKEESNSGGSSGGAFDDDLSGSTGGSTGNTIDSLVEKYSTLIAYSATNEAAAADVEALDDYIAEGHSYDDISKQLTDIYGKYDTDIQKNYYNTATQKQNTAAFKEIMKTAANVKDSLSDDDLKNPDLFTSDKISSQFNGYTAMAAYFGSLKTKYPDAFQDLQKAGDNDVVIVIIGTADGCEVYVDPFDSFAQ